MSSLHCPFCSLPADRVLLENDYALLIRDGFPVSEGHSLVIAKRHVASFFDLQAIEKAAVLQLLDEGRQALDRELSPDGYNIGLNDGESAGQTVMHLHVHLIPRYRGDADDPRGGVRWIFPGKAKYWKER